MGLLTDYILKALSNCNPSVSTHTGIRKQNYTEMHIDKGFCISIMKEACDQTFDNEVSKDMGMPERSSELRHRALGNSEAFPSS